MRPTKRQIRTRNKTCEQLSPRQQATVFKIALELMAKQLDDIYVSEDFKFGDRIATLYKTESPEQLFNAYVVEAAKIYNGEDSVIE